MRFFCQKFKKTIFYKGHSQLWKYISREKKSSLVSENRPGENHSPARIADCVSEYILLISKNKQTSKKKQEDKKKKSKQRRKENSPENGLKNFSGHLHFRKDEYVIFWPHKALTNANDQLDHERLQNSNIFQIKRLFFLIT